MDRRRIFGVIALVALVGSTLFVMTGARATDHVLRTRLDGDNEVCAIATCNDPNGTGRATVRLFPAAQKVCFDIRWARIESPYAAHIHRGAADEEGPVVVTLFTVRRLSKSVKRVAGCARGVDTSLVTEIKEHPRRFYLNVHTPAYEGGAIRGQLHA